jgi:hypothetical protein
MNRHSPDDGEPSRMMKQFGLADNAVLRAVSTEKSNPNILVMEAAAHWNFQDATDASDRAMDRRVLV